MSVSCSKTVHLCSVQYIHVLVDMFSVCCIVILIHTEASVPWCFISSEIGLQGLRLHDITCYIYMKVTHHG